MAVRSNQYGNENLVRIIYQRSDLLVPEYFSPVVAIVRHATDAIFANVHRVRTRIAQYGELCDGCWSHSRPDSIVQRSIMTSSSLLSPFLSPLPRQPSIFNMSTTTSFRLSLFYPSLYPLPNRPPPAPNTNLLAWAGATLICIFSLLIPPAYPLLRQALPIPIILYLLHHVRQTEMPNHFTDNYMINLYILWTLMRWVDFTIIHSPAESSLHRISPEDGQPIETTDLIHSYPWHRKLYWNTSLMLNLRGIGWNWQIFPVPTLPSTRLHAVLYHLSLILKYTIIADLRTYLITHTTLLAPQTTSTYFALPLWHQTLYVAIGILNSAAATGLPYHLAAAVLTTLHLCHPNTWPPVFGSWFPLTVRHAWGTLWHQYLRRFFTISNKLLLSTLRIKRGTLLSKYIQIYFAFLLSALFHHFGSWNLPYMDSVPYQFLFFTLQPICITIEDTAIATGEKAGIQDGVMVRMVGCIWTFIALGFTGRYMAVYFIENGTMFAPHPALFSVWEYVLPLVGIDPKPERLNL